jgi:nitrate reductase gamma subunit
VLFLLRGKDLSPARRHWAFVGTLRTLVNRSIPRKVFRTGTVNLQMALGYTFHLGLFVVLLLFVPHIEVYRGLIGISWPGVSNDLVMVSAVIAVGALVALFFHRITNPAQRVLSTADDYLSWLLTLLPFLTGLMATAHLGPRYETMLAWHLLTVEAFLIWFPFGKLMHTVLVFPSRIEMGANYARRGVEI